jgi:hypothetical protein
MSNPYGITTTDLYKYGLNQTATIGLDPLVLQAEIDASCSWADSKMRGRYPLPILGSIAGGVGVYDPAIIMHICYHAAFNVMTARGFNPDGGSDTNYKTRYEIALDWFDGVQRQRVHPDVMLSPTAPPSYQLPTVNTQPKRGW